MIPLEWWGSVSYADALERQRARREAVISGRASEGILMMEHPPVITTGRRAVAELPPARQATEAGIELHKTERGGLATFHGPGQLVGYVIVNVARRGGTVRGTVSAIESGLIAWLQGRGHPASTRPGARGVWLHGEKVAALGLHFRRGVSMHGFALNLQVDLGGFELIVPCGIADASVTRLANHEALSPRPQDAWHDVGLAVRRQLCRGWTRGA